MATEETLQEQPSALGQKSRFPEAEESFCGGSHDAPSLTLRARAKSKNVRWSVGRALAWTQITALCALSRLLNLSVPQFSRL